MTLWPDSVTLDGDVIPLADVAADITIHHGREEINAEPSATTCQLTFYDVEHAFTRAFQVGVELAVTVTDGTTSHPRFTGRVTDATLEVADLTVVAVARLSTLGGYVIGLDPWPVEPWSARMERIFAEAGLEAALEFYPDPEFDPELTAREPEPTTLAEYLGSLVPMIGAAVTDRPDGRILVQAIGARSLADVTPLAPADVAYAPVWEQLLPGGNIVTVRYLADQAAEVTLRDETSILLYGERPTSLDTTFVHAADATTRATQRLARGSFPHWNVRDAPIVRGLLLSIGQPVELSSLPAGAPFDPWTPFVEGWEETISGPDWTMRLALSDPLASALVLPWNGVPVETAWNEADPATAWREALTLTDL